MNKVLLVFALFQLVQSPPHIFKGSEEPRFVQAIKIEIPAPHPCNLGHGAITEGNMIGIGSCLTGPETRITCQDKSRVVLTAEDGKQWCMAVEVTR